MFRKKTIISSKKQKALKNIGWALCGKIVNLMGMLIVGIIVARYLGKEQYGIMNYVISIVTIFQVFADFGLDFIQIREESKTPYLKDKIIGTTFILKLSFAFLAFLAVTIISLLFEKYVSISLFMLSLSY